MKKKLCIIISTAVISIILILILGLHSPNWEADNLDKFSKLRDESNTCLVEKNYKRVFEIKDYAYTSINDQQIKNQLLQSYIDNINNNYEISQKKYWIDVKNTFGPILAEIEKYLNSTTNEEFIKNYKELIPLYDQILNYQICDVEPELDYKKLINSIKEEKNIIDQKYQSLIRIKVQKNKEDRKAQEIAQDEQKNKNNEIKDIKERLTKEQWLIGKQDTKDVFVGRYSVLSEIEKKALFGEHSPVTTFGQSYKKTENSIEKAINNNPNSSKIIQVYKERKEKITQGEKFHPQEIARLKVIDLLQTPKREIYLISRIPASGCVESELTDRTILHKIYRYSIEDYSPVLPGKSFQKAYANQNDTEGWVTLGYCWVELVYDSLIDRWLITAHKTYGKTFKKDKFIKDELIIYNDKYGEIGLKDLDIKKEEEQSKKEKLAKIGQELKELRQNMIKNKGDILAQDVTDIKVRELILSAQLDVDSIKLQGLSRSGSFFGGRRGRDASTHKIYVYEVQLSDTEANTAKTGISFLNKNIYEIEIMAQGKFIVVAYKINGRLFRK